jgi:hypothetical protein
MKRSLVVTRYSVLLLALLAVFVTGCGLVGSAPPATEPPQPTAEPATPIVVEPTVAPTEPGPEPTATPEAGPLPAPLYFIAAADGQIWRVERNGDTATQITHEAEAVTYFDVSPVDGMLVYVSGNSLILAGADGGDRQLVFGGPQDFPEDQAINNTITHPRWSPNGRQIAFGYGGIQVLDLDSPMLTPNVLIPSDPVPDMTAGRPPDLVRFYRHAIWSPDGSKLLVEFFYWPEGGSWAMLLLNSDAELVEFQSPPEGGILCCEATWSLDGEYVYFGSPYIGMGSPGLRRVHAASGQVETLIAPAGEPGQETYFMVEKAQQLADGSLYYFFGTVQGFPTGSFTPLTLYRAGPDAANGTPLRQDSYTLEEALWARDASGAVIMEVGPDSVWPYHGALTWLPADGSAAIRLPVDGSSLAWGM